MDDVDALDGTSRGNGLRTSAIAEHRRTEGLTVDVTPDAPAPAAPTNPAGAERGTTVAHLAAALGFNRRTIYKLRKRGAPSSSDEPSWRLWLQREGIRCRAPLDVVVLDDQVDEEDDETEEPAAPSPATQPVAGAGISLPDSWSQEKARRDALLKTAQQRKVELEVGELERVLVPRADVTAIVEAFATAVLGELVALPVRAVQAAEGLPAEYRSLVRKAAERELEAMRRRLLADLRDKVRAALARRGGGHG